MVVNLKKIDIKKTNTESFVFRMIRNAGISDIKKVLKMIGIALSVLLAGFSIFYFIKDLAHWYVYLFFLVIGVVFFFSFMLEKAKMI